VVFGLTGGIASGKSTVARRFAERGLDVIDADQVARDVVAPGSPGLAAVVQAFGPEILTGDGTLDRPALRERVFGDDTARKTLNAILHPRIGAETMRRTQALAAQGVGLACYEAALLVENGLADAFRPLVVVAVSPEVQRTRLMARDGASAEAAERALAAQLPLEDKVKLADHVIDNDGELAGLITQADSVLDAIRTSTEAGAR
jgi:dephospho-CoA kinase